MKKKHFNKKSRKIRKVNLGRYSARKKRISKRIGGIIDVSVVVENRNITTQELSKGI